MIDIGWIDFSVDDRKKVKQLLTLIKPEGQLDELGIGYIRDAISNKLFPGISTIQTRAKYFFIIPCILKDYSLLPPKERKQIKPQDYLDTIQNEIQDILKEKYDGTSIKGVIGFTMGHNKYVKRKPSEIYWNGLNTFAFIYNNGLSLNHLLTNAHKQNRYLVDRHINDGDSDDLEVSIENTFRIQTPYNRDWKKQLHIELTKDEAQFFTQRLEDKENVYLIDTLLFELFDNEELMELFMHSNNFHEFAINSQSLDINSQVKTTLAIGHDFYVVMEACHLFYNHLLQKHFFTDYQDEYLLEYENWVDQLEVNMIKPNDFNLSTLFSITGNRNYNQAEIFIKGWWNLLNEYRATRQKTILSKMEVHILHREQVVKRGKARLQKSISNNLDVKRNKRIGILDMNYRYYNAKTIISDILNPKIDIIDA